MRPLAILTILSLSFLSPISTLADDGQPVPGKEVFEAFKKAITSSKTPAPSLPKIYDQPSWGVHLNYPENWTYADQDKTSTKMNIVVTPMSGNKDIRGGSIVLRIQKKSVPQSLASVEKYFDANAYLSDSQPIGDWFIPSMSNLEKSDVMINGQAAKQYMYTSYRGEHYIGVSRVFFIGNYIYDFEMFSSPGWAAKVYTVFDAMSQDLRIGAAQASSSSRTKVPAQNTRFAVPSSQSSSSRASSVGRRTGASVSSVRRSVRSSKASVSSKRGSRPNRQGSSARGQRLRLANIRNRNNSTDYFHDFLRSYASKKIATIAAPTPMSCRVVNISPK